jgi:hypothetical protein
LLLPSCCIVNTILAWIPSTTLIMSMFLCPADDQGAIHMCEIRYDFALCCLKYFTALETIIGFRLTLQMLERPLLNHVYKIGHSAEKTALTPLTLRLLFPVLVYLFSLT